MREILFRGKRTDGQWVYGYLSKSRDMSERPAVLKSCIDYEVDGVMYSYIILPETVGQYTGMKDRYGNRIFEGDVLRYESDGDLYVVEYGKFGGCRNTYSYGYMGFGLTGCTEKERDFMRRGVRDDICYYADRCKVAGNVYDTPELLEVQK